MNIFLHGFDQRTAKAFEIFFSTKCSSMYSRVNNPSDAAIAIVDFDVFNDKKKIIELRRNKPELMLLLVSLRSYSSNDATIICLKKPLSYLELKKELGNLSNLIDQRLPGQTKKSPGLEAELNISINEITEHKPLPKKHTPSNEPPQINKQAATQNSVSAATSAASTMDQSDETDYVGANPDIDLSDTELVKTIYYSPQDRFQGAVIKAMEYARQQQHSVQLVCLNTGVIIDISNDTIYTAVTDRKLRPLCLMKVEAIDSLTTINGKISGSEILALANNKEGDLKCWSIESFLWNIALWTSRGYLPVETDLSTPAYLSQWPNFTRLHVFPEAMRIAALLVQKPTRLGEVAKQLDIPQRYVFSFFSAASVLGICGISRRERDRLFQPDLVIKDIAPRSILKKMLGRLMRLK